METALVRLEREADRWRSAVGPRDRTRRRERMMLTGAEEAQLRAALDRYPDPSEWKAAQQFFASQRTRAVDAEDVLRDTFVD